MIRHEQRNSELYETLAWMGLLSTEECRIRNIREHDTSMYIDLDLTHEDIERIGYLNPHVIMDPRYKGKTELWYNDTYLHPDRIMWIETVSGLYAVLDQQYDESVHVKCHYNPNILYRYSMIIDHNDLLTHTVTIDLSDLKYAEIDHIEHCAYYISENKICIPEVIRVDDNTLMFKAPYHHDIDFFICSNIANVVQMNAGQGAYIDQLYSNRTYHKIVVDHDITYPIDARFYPCIMVDKDCVVRVYTDSYSSILYPEVSRLMAYDEFLTIDDPYNTSNEYLATLPIVDDVIRSIDTDDEVTDKFSRIAAYCYRVWENFPYNSSEASNFVICDNNRLGYSTFTVHDVYLYDQQIQKICSNVPYEPYRDIIFYNGMVFSDYVVKKIRITNDNKFTESESGTPIYLIDSSYDPNKFTLIKFNTDQDTVIDNIGEYINTENIARLHFKLNRLYRNLMVIRQQFLDSQGDDYVRLATVQPTAKDQYLWFELLINAIPEQFETRPIETIDLYGLDPNNIPDNVREGAYRMDLDPEDGPDSYTGLFMTYYNLSKNKKDFLALQYGDGMNDPRIGTFDHVGVGNPAEARVLNAMAIEDHTIPEYIEEKQYESGYHDTPVTSLKDHTPGDLYFKNHDLPEIPDGMNIDISEISMGPQMPECSEDKLWLDTDGEKMVGVIPANFLDSVTDMMHIVNDTDEIENPDMMEYAIDSNDDTFSDDETGEFSIDDLIGDSDGSAEEIGQMSLEPIQFVSEETGETITMDEIAQLSREQKLDVVRRLITDDDVPEDAESGDIWISYLSNAPEGVLNTVVYKVLLTAHVYDISKINNGDIAIEGDTLPETEESLAYGDHPEWVRQNQMLIQPHPIDESGNVQPYWDAVREHNVKYIMSYYEPDDPEVNDVWIDIPASVLGDIIKDVISSTIMEIGAIMPDGFYDPSGYDTYATMAFDYHPHDKGTDGLGELFRERIDNSLHPVHYGELIDESTLNEDDIWYEFLDEVSSKVVYSDRSTMIVRIDERLYLLQFAHDNITAYAFDDIYMNFHGVLGIRYLSILADLINSGEIKLDDINIFYRRLITHEDEFDPQLKRLYTGTSHVISTIKIDPSDYSILYSSNIGRFRMDYSDPTTTNRERGHAYRMCIDYSARDFAFLHKRMLLFVNGKYIPTDKYTEDQIGMIRLLDFHEIIASVDILYNKKDLNLIQMKRCTQQFWPIDDSCVSIQRPSNYAVMEPIKIHNYTKKGYYDILINEFIFNGKLPRILNYLEEHPEEAEAFKNDLVSKFHAISDIDLCGFHDHTARIIISGESNGDAPYIVQE